MSLPHKPVQHRKRWLISSHHRSECKNSIRVFGCIVAGKTFYITTGRPLVQDNDVTWPPNRLKSPAIPWGVHPPFHACTKKTSKLRPTGPLWKNDVEAETKWQTFSKGHFQMHSLGRKWFHWNTIWLKFVSMGPINNKTAIVQIMAWYRTGDKPLSEPMMA